MSTRCTIINTSLDHIFEETSEPNYSLTTFIGHNIYACFDGRTMKKFSVKDGFLKVTFNDGEMKSVLGEEFIFHGSDIIEIEWDCDGLAIQIKGGSYTGKKLIENKNF